MQQTKRLIIRRFLTGLMWVKLIVWITIAPSCARLHVDWIGALKQHSVKNSWTISVSLPVSAEWIWGNDGLFWSGIRTWKMFRTHVIVYLKQREQQVYRMKSWQQSSTHLVWHCRRKFIGHKQSESIWSYKFGMHLEITYLHCEPVSVAQWVKPLLN